MKPNFALSLSFEGIRLLHRSGTVWSVVGEVALDASDLAGQLAVLRKTGLALDPQGLRTKLLIPNEQIKYLALDTTRTSDDDVRRALDGATPYAVADLCYDAVRGGGRTYIAAVARETLAEAEAFAAEHRFGPVCFAGVPEPFTYVGEAFFGPTSMADRLIGPGQQVERDDLPVQHLPKPRGADVLSAALKADAAALPDLAPAPDEEGPASVDDLFPAEIPPSEPVPAEIGAFDVTPIELAPIELVATEMSPAESTLPESALPESSPPTPAPFVLTVADSIAAAPADPRQTAATATLLTAPEPALPNADLPPPDLSALVFAPQDPTIFDSSTVWTLALPNLPGQTLDEDAPFIDMRFEPEIEPAAEAESLEMAKPSLIPQPVFASRARPLRADSTDVPAAQRPLPPPPGSKTPASTTPASLAQRSDDRAEPVFSRRAEPPLARPVQMAHPVAPAMPGETADAMPPAGQLAAQLAVGHISPAMVAPRLTGADRSAAEPPVPRPFNAKLPEAAAAPPVTGQSSATRPVAAATVIPFRPNTDHGDQPAATPVSIETVTLIPSKPATAAVAVTGPSLEPGKTGYFASQHGGGDRTDKKAKAGGQLAQLTAPGRIAAQPTLSSALAVSPAVRGRPRYLALILTLILLACLAAVAAWASFMTETGLAGLFGGSSTTEVAATDDLIAPPDMTETALIAPADSSEPAAPVLTPDTAPDVAALPDLATPEATADAVATVPAELVALEPAVEPVAETGTAVSPAEADRIYAATGVWLRAPRLPLIPTSDPVGSLTLAALDAGADRVALPEMPGLAGAAPDQAMLTPVDPPAPGTVFLRDARGFVLATPEGTLTPNGIMVFAGLPTIIPPARPGTPVPEVVGTVVAPPVPETGPTITAAVAAPPLAPRPTTIVADPAVPALSGTAVIDPVTAGGIGLGAIAPTVRPLLRPGTPAATVTDAPVLVAFAGPRPQTRPAGLAPQPDPAAIAEGAALPPDATTGAIDDTVAAILAAAPPDSTVISGTALAIASARLPELRPQNFAAVVASAQERSVAAPQNPSLAMIDPPPEPPPVADVPVSVEPAPEALVPEAQVPDEVVAPSGPIPGGVAANATLAEAIDLREVNLIGVFGRPNDRRALVRLANGRYVRVAVGDSLDGGQVAAIGDNALNYVKRGQTITIAIPNG